MSVDVSFEVLQGEDPDITWSPSLQPVRPFTFTVFVNGTKYDSTDLVRELAQHLQAVANKQSLDYSTGTIRVIEPTTEKEMYVSKFSPNMDEPIHVRQSNKKLKNKKRGAGCPAPLFIIHLNVLYVLLLTF